MRRHLIAPLSLLLVGFVYACSSTPPAPEPGVSPIYEQPRPVSTLANETAAPPAPSTSSEPVVVVPIDPVPPPTAVAVTEPPKPRACPSGMKLVEGDYCTKVKQTCLVEWWAPQNKKRVCEQFKPPTTCIGKRVKKRFCIDTFSWPNKRGVRPEVMNTFWQAQLKCAAVGKRMCTESEWNFACEGPEMKPFPHGYVRDPKKCNGDHRWDNPSMRKVAKRDARELARLWRGVPSGSQPECVSDFGVHDLPANNDEVVAGETGRERFSAVHTGGPWYSGVRNQCRPKVYTHGEDFYYYFLGFRCCSEPDGKKNDPRTPKQIKSKWKLSRLEFKAGMKLDVLKRVLASKERGRCDCTGVKGAWGLSRNIMCKTMCGTLLGPGFKDGDDSTRVPHRKRRQISH